MTLQDILAMFQAPRAPQPVSVRPDYGLTGAMVQAQAKSPYERTMRPGETRSAGDLQDMLAEVILAAGGAIGGLPSSLTGARPPQGIGAPKSTGRVLYHGSQGPIVGEFDPAKATNYYSQVLGVPTFFFTNNKTMASSYGPTMTRASVKMRRPLKVDAQGKTFDEVLPAIENGLGIYRNKEHKKWANEFAKVEAKYGEESVQMGTAPRDVIARLDKMHSVAMAKPEEKQFSHDGVVIKNVWDWGAHQPLDANHKPFGDVYMALSPKQINKVDSR